MSDIRARHLHVEESDSTLPFPKMVSFYAIKELPQYKFDSNSIIRAVDHLLKNGAQPITIFRVMEDTNFPPNSPESAQQTIDFIGEDVTRVDL